MSELRQKERLWYIDYLRITAIIAVVTIHISAQVVRIAEIGSFPWVSAVFYNSISRWGVDVFVMISGALFLDPSKNRGIRAIYSKNLLRIVTAFLFWSAVYAAVDYLNGVRLMKVFRHFVYGGSHLWYLYMIAGLYLIVPILRRITESEKITKYYLILWFVFSIAYYTLKSLFACVDVRISEIIERVWNESSLYFVYSYTGYFILGHWLCQNDMPKKYRRIVYAIGCFGAASTILLTVLVSRKDGSLDETFLEYFSANVMFEAVAVFVFIKYHTPEIRSEITKKTVLLLSKCSFGVYLVHFLIMHLLKKYLGISALSFHPLLSVPLIGGLVLALSYCVSYLLNKIPVIKKYIV
ncbi:MAG: acyltransferase family protein [Clostridia bacterium]|nr:acyltransferase family protein [Clostridia bacterium]